MNGLKYLVANCGVCRNKWCFPRATLELPISLLVTVASSLLHVLISLAIIFPPTFSFPTAILHNKLWTRLRSSLVAFVNSVGKVRLYNLNLRIDRIARQFSELVARGDAIFKLPVKIKRVCCRYPSPSPQLPFKTKC